MRAALGLLKFAGVVSVLVLASVGAQAAKPSAPPFGPPAPPFGDPQASSKAATPQVAPIERQPSAELVYKPIPPCRAISGQAIAANSTRNFQITGVCGVPAYAKAVAFNLSANASAAAGGLTAYAAGTARPPISTLSVPVSGGFGTAGSTVELGTSGAMSIYASKPTTVYGDVTGYYAQQIQGMISNTGTSIYSGSTGIVSSVQYATGVFKVTVDRDVTYCTPVVTPYSGTGIYATAFAFDRTTVTIYMWTLDLANNLTKPASIYVYLAIHC